MVFFGLNSQIVELIKETSKYPILSAFVSAFLKAEMGKFGTVPESTACYQRVVIFLSELGMDLTKKLAQMPPAFASIIRTTLIKCLAHPPPNCSPEVYRLIGKALVCAMAWILCLHDMNTTYFHSLVCRSS